MNLLDLLFPMLTIEGGNLEQTHYLWQRRTVAIAIQTAEIDIVPIGMRSRAIEGMNATTSTKMMLGGTRIKSIGTQRIFALEQSKSRCGDDEMDEAFFRTDRAITFDCC